jgi:hypothetical protein
MGRVRRVAFLLAPFLLLCTSAQGSDYQVNVTRKSSQLYKITSKDIYINTRACFEFVYYEDAVLRMSGRTGTIVFLDAGAKCDVKSVYGKTSITPGNYTVRLTSEADDWYSVAGSDLMIRTMLCYKSWFGEEVTLKIGSGGAAILVDEDGDTYSVDGIYVTLSL